MERNDDMKRCQITNIGADHKAAQKLGNLCCHVACARGALEGYGHKETAAFKSLQHVQDELMKMYKALGGK